MSKEDDEEANDFLRVLQLNNGSILGMVMKAAIELDLFEIMAKAAAVNGTSPFGDNAKMLSSDDIVAHLPTQNPTAPAMLDRILRFLATKSILTWTIVSGVNGKDKNFYGLASICRYYISDKDGVSLAPSLVMLHDKCILDSWYYLKDAVLDGGIPFNKDSNKRRDHIHEVMQWILHDWSDDQCIILLKNCYNALPEYGKVIILESVVVPGNSIAGSSWKSNSVLDADMIMLASSPGGKERSLKEFEALAIESGFEAVELICTAAIYSVFEFYKKV